MKLPSLIGWAVILGAGTIGAWNLLIDYERGPLASVQRDKTLARVTLYTPYRDLYVMRRDGLGLRIVEVQRPVPWVN